MRLLTFLDDAAYPKTTFVWKDRRFAGRFSPAAMARFLKPEELVVFLTRPAQENVLPALQAELPAGLTVSQVLIPPGAEQAELWQMAQLVNQNVAAGSEIAMDISHGPLSFPLVGLMVAIYLRTTRDVELRAILYAAYGVDEEPGSRIKPGETPIFDLAVMLSWLEWSVAVDRFNATGDSLRLAALVQAERKRLGRSAQDDARAQAQLGSLGKLSGVLKGLSRSLHMIRPRQAMEYAADLPQRVREAEPLFAGRPISLAYSLVLERVLAAYAPLGLADAETQTARQVVNYERRLINWYAERELWVEAVTLAREWTISWTMAQLGLDQLTKRPLRLRIESVVSAEAQDFLAAGQQKRPYQAVFLRDLPMLETVLRLWLDVTEVRNDINHAGMRDRPGRPEDLIERIQASVRALNSLPV